MYRRLFMNDINMGNDLTRERQEHEYQKYGRSPHPESAAFSHRYLRHSITNAYGGFSEPINEPNQ
jgi:hypothetical protein